MPDKTIESVIEDGLCTGCGTCVGLCPKGALEMVIDRKKGIYVPKLDKEKCNDCGLCFDVCPGHSVDFRKLNREIFGMEPGDILLGNYLNCYTGYATDYDIRYNSASGGLVTALLIFALEEGLIDGALVTKMRDDRPLEPQPFIARTRAEIVSASKSKYCPVPANVTLKEIIEAEEGERFAIVGLPCHIHGVRKAEKINKKLKEKIALHFGITCSRSDRFTGTEFVLQKYGIKMEDVVKLDYRGQGWPGSMAVYLHDGKAKLVPYQEYIRFHELSFFTPSRCLLCCDLSAELADISFADAWLPKLKEVERTGKSLLLTRSSKGEDLLQEAASKADIEIDIMSHVPSTIGGDGKKTTSQISLSFRRLTCKKAPYFSQITPRKLTAYPLAILAYFNIGLSRRPFFWLISPLAYVERQAINLGIRILRR